MSDDNGSSNTMTEDERRRKQEINMFAAFAQGAAGEDANNNDDSNNAFDGSSLRIEKKSPAAANEQKPPEPQRSVNDTNFLAAARGGAPGFSSFQDSGSFAFQSTSSKANRVGAAAEHSNLSAAVAALSKDDRAGAASTTPSSAPIKLVLPHNAAGLPHNAAPTHFRNNHVNNSTSNNTNNTSNDPANHNNKKDNSSNNANKDIPEDQIPMFAEEVVLERPLFFGAIVPPRVLNSARAMVQTAVAQKQAQGVPHPRLHELPVAVRNVVGALRTYGYGLHELLALEPATVQQQPTTTTTTPGSSNNTNGKKTSFEDETSEPYFARGNTHVTTFQPVWGSDVRAQRVKEYRAQRAPLKKPSIVSRVSTAPPRMLVQSDDDDNDDDDDDDDE